ncbi:MAG: FkbM family methyltransferase [Actinomycetota bacterium]
MRADIDGVRFVMLDPSRCEIAKELYWGNGRRPRPEDDLALRLASGLATGSDVFLDVGAYTGIFSLVVARSDPHVDVHAFEIVPAVVTMLRANIERNGLADRITIHAEGIGDPSTIMRVPEGTGGSALPSFFSSRMRFIEGVQVPFRSLDSLEGLVPARARVVMKIDVEGTEDDIFEHGQRFLERTRADIICEVLPGVADGQRLTRLLQPHGYRFCLITPTGLASRSQILPDAGYRDWLFTCRSEEEVMSAVGRLPE